MYSGYISHLVHHRHAINIMEQRNEKMSIILGGIIFIASRILIVKISSFDSMNAYH